MERFATGAWLDRRLARVAATAFGLFALALIAAGLAGRTGTLDAWGRPLGSDFSGIYAAGRLALEGRTTAVYDWARHAAAQRAAHGTGEGGELPFYPWHYPPVFLLVAAPLALLPYLAALALWQGATLAAALVVVRRILPDRDTLLVAIGGPAVFVCLAHGQNGFLTAALFGGGLLVLERRPALGGALLGCLCYKPHLGIIIPLALMAGGHWRAIAGAAAAVAALALASLAAFGPDAWTAFAGSLPETRRVTLEEGGTGWYKVASLFAYVRMMGGSLAAASALQAVVTAGAIAGTAWLWWIRAAFPLRAAALLAGSLLATPYLLDYDLVLLGPAIAFLARHGFAHGFRRWEATLFAFCWFVPLASRHLAFFAGLPAAWFAVAALFAVAIGRAVGQEHGHRMMTVP